MQCWMQHPSVLFFVSQHLGTQQVCLFYSRQLWYCYGTIMPYSLIQSLTENEAVKDSYLALVTVSIRTCTRCFDFILDWSQHHIICCLPQFHSQIHDPSVWRLQLQHRQNKFHQACREAVIHWSVTVIWNLIYLPPAARLTLCNVSGCADRFINCPKTGQQCCPQNESYPLSVRQVRPSGLHWDANSPFLKCVVLMFDSCSQIYKAWIRAFDF